MKTHLLKRCAAVLGGVALIGTVGVSTASAEPASAQGGLYTVCSNKLLPDYRFCAAEADWWWGMNEVMVFDKADDGQDALVRYIRHDKGTTVRTAWDHNYADKQGTHVQLTDLAPTTEISIQACLGDYTTKRVIEETCSRWGTTVADPSPLK
ncbi:hypothetical protein ACFVT5_12055 [Streptomyces sp. NPDC058001]|uniref:hypothetical protein n=1 Tax=Streptomyces sp. NPDC058001 TaxID=3346300 RepID=UPI0036E67F93